MLPDPGGLACYAQFLGHSTVADKEPRSGTTLKTILGEEIEFRDRHRAELNFGHIISRVSSPVWQSLRPLLVHCPDPDSALNLFERLTEIADADLLRLFERHRFLTHYALVVFGYSQWLGETLIRNTDLFHGLAREKNLDLSHSIEDFAETFARFRSRSLENDTSLLLARFKRREYVRIMLRDVLGIAKLAETTAEISALSDVLIEEALRDADMALRNRYGAPQHLDSGDRLVDTPFAVLSLGKLGGNELNYSSDVDLMFIHGDGREPPSASVSNHEYFVRLAQLLTEILSRATPEGVPFRIDLRLRPQGGEGDPAVGVNQALDYYAHRAGDWERQALIKVRHTAGDQKLARRFIRNVQPFVYTEQVNFAAVETAIESRERMLTRRRRPIGRGSIDVKTDRGGIRDIEFLVQCLQRVYGGTELWLRSGGTLFSLAKLHDKGHISPEEFHQLTSAYEFLRAIEHRLQLRQGQQTHHLPQAPNELRVLERSLTEHRAVPLLPGGLELAIRERMAAVTAIYTRIVHHQQLQKEKELAADDFHLVGGGVSAGEEEHSRIIERLSDDAPELAELARHSDFEPHTRRNLQRFLTAAFTTPERYAALLNGKEAVNRAMKLFALSDFLTDVLVRHPEEISVLSRNEISTQKQGSLLTNSSGPDSDLLDPKFAYVVSPDLAYEEKLALLRRIVRSSSFEIAARDVLRTGCVYDSLKAFSRVADQAIRAAFTIAGAPEGLAVMALGRLGTHEADLFSDADLLFVRDESLDSAVATRSAEQIVEVLSAYTREGSVFAVDTRLRPNGLEGELVVTPSHLQRYFADPAQPWEALTYTKLRHIAGARRVADEVVHATTTLFGRFANSPHFAPALHDIRLRLEKIESDGRNLKTSPGGLYDLDYIIGYLLVRKGHVAHRGNFRDAISSLASSGRVSKTDAGVLQQAGVLLRTVEHAIRLVLGRARKTLPAAGPARQAIEQLTLSAAIQEPGYHDLDAILQRTFLSVREIYRRILL